MAARMPAWCLRLLVATLAVGLSLTVAEIGLRTTGMDRRYVAPALYFQDIRPFMYRVSDNPFLRYELAPGADLLEAGPYGVHQNHVNAQGARGPERSTHHGPDLFRILVFGASSVYGEAVNDDETVVARLEQTLRARSGADVEAWNFGVSAYVLAQMTCLARRKVEEIQTDLVVVMVSNVGRRPFLQEGPHADYLRFFRADPTSWAENFVPPSFVPRSVHEVAIRHLAIYRDPVALSQSRGAGPPEAPGDELSAREARSLVDWMGEKGIPLVFATVPGSSFLKPDHVTPGLSPRLFIDLSRPDEGEDYKNPHPPPAILARWAEDLAKELVDRGFVPP